MGPVDVETIRLLVAIDEYGSLGAAARHLDISQPAASARLRAAEARWRLALVNRSARGSSLTTDGAAVVSWGRPVLHEIGKMEASLAALSSKRGGGITIAASLTIAEFLLPRWLGELRTRLPQVHAELTVVNSEEVAGLVHGNRADVGFIETPNRPTDLSHRQIGIDRLVVVTSPNHPWAKRRTPLSRAQLAEAEFVIREPGSGTRDTFERAIRQIPRIALQASSTTAVIGAAIAEVGPAVISKRAVEPELETGRLVAVPTVLDLRRPLTAIWQQQRRLRGAVADLLLIAAEAQRHH